MEVSNEILWLIAGVLMVLAEFIAVPGVGFLFGGIGALVAGIAVTANPELQPGYQWIIFLGVTSIAAALLYKPMKNFRTPHGGEYNDMLGHTALTLTALEGTRLGQAKWSGTNMRARSEDGEEIPANTEVTIASVDGNILIVRKKV